MTFAFINISLAAWPSKSLWTIASKRPRCINTDTIVFARRSLVTFIDVFGAVNAFVTRRTRARKRSIYRACIANSIGMTRIRGASILQMAQETRFTRRTMAIEASHAIDTGCTVETGCIHTIVDVHTAIRSRPAIDTNTRITTHCIRTGCTILANGRTCGTFVDVDFAIFTGVILGALATVRVHTVDAFATVLT